MERTYADEAEQRRRRALADLAAVVRRLAEERHEDSKHGRHDGTFRNCADAVCVTVRDAARVLA